MIGSGEIITQRRGGVGTEKYRSGIADSSRPFLGLLHNQLDMLRGDGIGKLERFRHSAHHDDRAIFFQRFESDGLPFGLAKLQAITFKSLEKYGAIIVVRGM